MSTRLTKVYIDCMNGVKSINTEKSRPRFKEINIFTNQINKIKDPESNKGYSFNFPACFVEIDLGEQQQLGYGITSYPFVLIKFHIADNLIDGGRDTMERNTRVFDYKNEVVALFNRSGKVDFCSALSLHEEEQDFDHNNIYSYVVTFKTNFTDNNGSSFNDNTTWGSLNDFIINMQKQLNAYIDAESNEVYTDESGNANYNKS